VPWISTWISRIEDATVNAAHLHQLVDEAPTGDRVGAQRRQLFIERLDPGLPIDQRVDLRRDERHQWTDVQIERCLPEAIEVDRAFVRFHAGANARVGAGLPQDDDDGSGQNLTSSQGSAMESPPEHAPHDPVELLARRGEHSGVEQRIEHRGLGDSGERGSKRRVPRRGFTEALDDDSDHASTRLSDASFFASLSASFSAPFSTPLLFGTQLHR
jgi:hypothetical protein